MVNLVIEMRREIADGARSAICYVAYISGFLAVIAAVAISAGIVAAAVSSLL